VVPKVIEHGGGCSRVAGQGASTVDVAAPASAEGLGSELALQLHEAPDLGAVRADVGLDVGGQLTDGGQVDAEQLRAPSSGAAIGRPRSGSCKSPPQQAIEHMFEIESGMLPTSTGETWPLSRELRETPVALS
jgi:hypothetical protein